jgi:hypothetical protein
MAMKQDCSTIHLPAEQVQNLSHAMVAKIEEEKTCSISMALGNYSHWSLKNIQY